MTIYQLSQSIPEHLNLHLVPQIRMCRALPPFPMYFHGTWTRVPLLYQHASVTCLQLTCDHHIKMYVTAVIIIREFAGAWKKPLGRKNTCNKYHTCKVSLQYEFVGEQLIHPWNKSLWYKSHKYTAYILCVSDCAVTNVHFERSTSHNTRI